MHIYVCICMYVCMQTVYGKSKLSPFIHRSSLSALGVRLSAAPARCAGPTNGGALSIRVEHCSSSLGNRFQGQPRCVSLQCISPRHYLSAQATGIIRVIIVIRTIYQVYYTTVTICVDNPHSTAFPTHLSRMLLPTTAAGTYTYTSWSHKTNV